MKKRRVWVTNVAIAIYFQNLDENEREGDDDDDDDDERTDGEEELMEFTAKREKRGGKVVVDQ